MFKVIDLSSTIYNAYEFNKFSLTKWEKYLAKLPYVKDLCLEEMKQNVSLTYSWDDYYLPVLDAVVDNKDEVLKLQEVFNIVINGLEDKIIKKFGKELDVEIVLYLGLCNGAGWVTEFDDKTLILLGIEKIIELKWNNINDLNGLIIHELGHAYQKQYGVIELASNELGDNFMWQLFIEGIAMVFEQEILEDINYFYQDRDGYLVWCKNNIKKIAIDFEADYKTMSQENQRYFGDWVNYEGHHDVGYYLGSRFVRFILDYDSFNNVISYDINKVKNMYYKFIETL